MNQAMSEEEQKDKYLLCSLHAPTEMKKIIQHLPDKNT